MPVTYRSPQRGFTLIELMVVVAIVGILAAIAVPSYQSQVRKSRRADAVQALVALQQAQERWRSNNTSYALTAQQTGAWPAGLGIASATAGGYYTISITGVSTGSTYTAQAVGLGSQASDTGCTTLVTTVTNGTAINTPAACWSN